MKRLYVLLFLYAMSLPSIALASGGNYNESGPGPIQDHTCQGGHNCNTHGSETGTPTTYIEPVQNVTLSPSQAQAQGQDQSQGQVQGQSQSADANSVSIADASNRNSNESSNANFNANYASGGQGGSAYSSQGNSQSINIAAPKTYSHGNNVAAYAPAIYSSSACTGGGLSGGASAFGAGISLGGSKQDKQCQVRENARILSGLDANLAIMYLCANPLVDVGAVLGTACRPPEAPAPVEPPHADPMPEAIPVPHRVVDDPVKG